MRRRSMKLWKRMTALLLVAIMSFLLPANNLAGQFSQAATSKKLYIGDLRVVMTDGLTSPQEWCNAREENKDADKGNDWYC